MLVTCYPLPAIHNIILSITVEVGGAYLMDDVDLAHEIEVERIDRLLANRIRDTLSFIGMCHNCLEPLPEAHFCDADCRDDYERRLRFQR